MAEKKETHTHSIVPKKLWQALSEASVQHFDAGGQALPAQQTTGSRGYTQTNGAGGFNEQTMVDSGRDAYGGSTSPQILMDAGGNTLGEGVNGLGGMMKDAAGAFTSQNEYQAQAPNISMQNFAPRVGQLQNQQTMAYGQQQNLANQLLAQSRGQGPNPAQAQLNQATGQNVAQQGSLMAGQRGASSNVGLMARQSAQQGAATQQNAAGQSASLQAQQQLAAQNALSSIYGNMANQSLQGESIQQGGQAAQNTAVTSGQLGAQQINANVAGQNASALNGTAGGISNALGAGLANSLAKGGVVKGYADGGIAEYSAPQTPNIQLRDWQNQGLMFEMPEGEKKEKPKEDKAKKPEATTAPQATTAPEIKTYPGTRQYLTPGYDEGGEVEEKPLMGIQDYTSSKSTSGGVSASAPSGGGVSAAAPGGGGGGGALSGIMSLIALAHGGPVPTDFVTGGPVGGKARVQGDSPTNDTVPAMVSPGEVVLPRSVVQGPDMEKKVLEFLRHLKKPKGGYGSVVESRKGKSS